MHESVYEWKLMEHWRDPRVTLLKSKNFVQNHCKSVTGNDHMQKSDTIREILCVQGGAPPRRAKNPALGDPRKSKRAS